ncbi:Hypothetical predicted protein [Mytilus galloprovincialis]|uniref:Mutator-like transposase domain-containing protein n=1 Tax=Mytilus galloprovincialis TaxID=29158 RepID=A0A8B6BLB3_MYTGA|nr:Hypothetical predicted protein [Mytilus galloprovincialis]
MTSLVQNIPYKDTDTQSVNDTKPAVLLRPRDAAPKITKTKKSAKKNQRSEDSSNRTELNAIMWNSVFREHQRLHPNMEREEKFGFVNREEAMCDKCNYQWRKFKLYEEVQTNKPGRKTAKINVSAQAALSQTPLGYTGLRKIVLGCNMPAPSASGLQKRANKVLPEIVNINKEDMKARRKQLIEINTLRGRKDPGSVSLQADGAYNNAIYSGIGKIPIPACYTSGVLCCKS